MAQLVIELVKCDRCGKDATEEVRLGIDGDERLLELCDGHLATLLGRVKPWHEIGSPVRRRRDR